MSLQACVIIGVVLLVREIFSRVGIAKKYINVLWMLPYVCMICPWKFEGAVGFWRQPQSNGGKYATQELLQALRTLKDGASNRVTEQALVTTETLANTEVSSGLAVGQAKGLLSTPLGYTLNADVLQVLLAIASVIWLVGVIGLILYSADAHLKLHRKLICCMRVKENIYLADDIKVPFVLGIFKPRIYLPCGMSELDKQYVVAHEKTHIRHLDPLKKAVAFGITCLHWFNPLAWVAFHFYSKDMEMACDEETVQQLGMEHRQGYATTLLSLATGKRLFLGAPLAFDEGNVKSRVKNIVKYKKTWKVLSLVAVAVIVALTIGFMTEHKEYVPLAKVQDMNHPPKEMASNAIIITLNGETKYFSGEGYFDEISKFLNGLEIRKTPKDQSRDENREKDVIIEYGALRFCFYADYTALWSDNDVKASFTYQVKNPEEVKTYLEGLFNGEPVVDENSFTEIFIGKEISKAEKETDAIMDDYFTCTLPEGTQLGDFTKYYNDVLSGCPILMDYEIPAHGEGTPEAWYVPGCVLIGAGAQDENNSLMRFENGKAVSVRWLGNHAWLEKPYQYVEGCEMQALLCEAVFDLFTVPQAEKYKEEHKLAEGELQTVSKYWYVFMGEEDSEYIYVVGLNQEYFTKEDVIELARSVHITYE